VKEERMDKIPTWAEPYLTKENIAKAVDSCLWADCTVCPLAAWEDCRSVLLEQLTELLKKN
jgi:hypothetical protein